MADKVIELLGDHVNTMEHEMKARGCHLKEIKQKIFIDSQFRLDKSEFKPETAIHEKTIIVHLRTILDDQHGLRSFKVIEGFPIGNRAEQTEMASGEGMTSGEVLEFEKDWKKLWHPKMTQEEWTNL